MTQETVTEDRLDKLMALLEPMAKKMSIGQRSYANKLLQDIVTDLNYKQAQIHNLEAKLNGFNDHKDYSTYFNKCVSVLGTMCVSEVEFEMLRKQCMDWIDKNKGSLKRYPTWQEIYHTHKALCLFETIHERYPVDFDELKKSMEDIKNG
jgi:hypothetical protein